MIKKLIEDHHEEFLRLPGYEQYQQQQDQVETLFSLNDGCNGGSLTQRCLFSRSCYQASLSVESVYAYSLISHFRAQWQGKML